MTQHQCDIHNWFEFIYRSYTYIVCICIQHDHVRGRDIRWILKEWRQICSCRWKRPHVVENTMHQQRKYNYHLTEKRVKCIRFQLIICGTKVLFIYFHRFSSMSPLMWTWYNWFLLLTFSCVGTDPPWEVYAHQTN